MNHFFKSVAACSLIFTGTLAVAAQNPVEVQPTTTTSGLRSATTINSVYTVGYTLTNNLPFIITNLAVKPVSDSGTFSLTSTTCTAVLASGANCTWSGTFTPSQMGATSLTLMLNYVSSVVPYTQSSTTLAQHLVAVGTVGGFDMNNDVTAPLVYTSSTGTSWTKQDLTAQPNAHFIAVTAHNDTWVAAGVEATGVPQPLIEMSTDNGVTWASQSLPATETGQFLGVSYGSGTYVAVGDEPLANQALLMTSTDGSAWTKVASISSDDIELTDVHYANSLWVAVGNDKTNPSVAAIYTSPDANTWAKATTISTQPKTNQANAESIELDSVSFGDGKWVAVGDRSSDGGVTRYPYMLTSTDGSSWTNQAGLSADDGALYTVHYANNKWVVAGKGSSPDFKFTLLTSTDTQTWTPLSKLPTTDEVYLIALSDLNGQWVVGGFDGTLSKAVLYTSPDAATWTEASYDTPSSNAVLGLAHN
jgi:hypothetical protein